MVGRITETRDVRYVTHELDALVRQRLYQIVAGLHGSPRRINEYLFEDRPLPSFERLAKSSGADVIVYGHTHRPYVKQVGGVLFVNVGSVGKPKDGDPRACYAIFDSAAAGDVRFVRVPYDLSIVAAAIRESELPDEFAMEIQTGGAKQ